MRTAQIVSLAFALAGYSMAAPAPQAAYSAPAAAATVGSTSPAPASGSEGPLLPHAKFTHYCEDPSNYAFQDMDVTVDPKMPTPGANMTVTIKANLKSAITQGTQQRVTFGKIENGEEHVLMTNTQDVCAGLEMAPSSLNVKQCPIPAGPFEWSNSYQIPTPPEGFQIPKMPKLSPAEMADAMKHLAALAKQAQENIPKGEFFMRGQTVDAQGKVLSCIYSELNPSEMLQGGLPGLPGAPANGTAMPAY